MREHKLFRHTEPYSPEEDQLIKDRYHDYTDKQLAIMLGRTLDSLRFRRVQKLGIYRSIPKPKSVYESTDPTKEDIEVEISSLVNFIESRGGEGLLVEIANRRRKDLLSLIKKSWTE